MTDTLPARPPSRWVEKVGGDDNVDTERFLTDLLALVHRHLKEERDEDELRKKNLDVYECDATTHDLDDDNDATDDGSDDLGSSSPFALEVCSSDKEIIHWVCSVAEDVEGEISDRRVAMEALLAVAELRGVSIVDVLHTRNALTNWVYVDIQDEYDLERVYLAVTFLGKLCSLGVINALTGHRRRQSQQAGSGSVTVEVVGAANGGGEAVEADVTSEIKDSTDQGGTSKSNCTSRGHRLSAEVLSLMGVNLIKLLIDYVELFDDEHDENKSAISRNAMFAVLAINYQFNSTSLDDNRALEAVLMADSVEEDDDDDDDDNGGGGGGSSSRTMPLTHGPQMVKYVNRIEDFRGDKTEATQDEQSLLETVLACRMLRDIFNQRVTADLCFYYNDLAVLIEVLIRSLTDLPTARVDWKRREYLRTMDCIFFKSELRYKPHRRTEAMQVLESLRVESDFSLDPTVRRLAEVLLQALRKQEKDF